MTEITNRDPSEMTHEALRAEWREAYERIHSAAGDGELDELSDRRSALWNEMKSRTDAEPPECPRCEGQSWGQAYGEPKVCTECDLHLGVNREGLIAEVDDYWLSVKSPPLEVAEYEAVCNEDDCRGIDSGPYGIRRYAKSDKSAHEQWHEQRGEGADVEVMVRRVETDRGE